MSILSWTNRNLFWGANTFWGLKKATRRQIFQAHESPIFHGIFHGEQCPALEAHGRPTLAHFGAVAGFSGEMMTRNILEL